LPEDWHVAVPVIEPLFDRLESDSAATQLLIVTNDAEAAAALAEGLSPAVKRRTLRLLAATDGRRALRVLRGAAAPVIVAPPAIVVELLQSTVLKLDAVRAV